MLKDLTGPCVHTATEFSALYHIILLDPACSEMQPSIPACPEQTGLQLLTRYHY